jgi:hypothetical protein
VWDQYECAFFTIFNLWNFEDDQPIFMMSETGKRSVLLFSYFKGPGDGLHLAWSEDGYEWQAVKADGVLLFPEVGIEKIMRDPFLFAAADGLFHLVWTCGWREKGIGYASSPDLIHWFPQRYLGVMEHESDARNCWAPEIFYDAVRDHHIIYWATSIRGRFSKTDGQAEDGLNHRMYYVTTQDFVHLSETRLFYDGGFNVIDATIVKDTDRYLMFMKNETADPCEKNIRLAVSKDLYSGFEEVSRPITGRYWAEGPSAIKIGDQWIVYFDKYKLNEIGAVASHDLLSWRDISSQVHFPRGAQHGSVTRIAFELLMPLL